MDNDELKILKERVLAELREWLPAYRERMDAIDSRIESTGRAHSARRRR